MTTDDDPLARAAAEIAKDRVLWAILRGSAACIKREGSDIVEILAPDGSTCPVDDETVLDALGLVHYEPIRDDTGTITGVRRR